MDDFKAVADNSDCHEFLSIVTSVHHKGVGESLHNWTLSFSESLNSISSSGVGKIDSVLLFDRDVILERKSCIFLR